MYSLNVPVPGAVERLTADLHPRLTAFDRIRERHTLVAKRLGEGPPHRLRERLRDLLRGTDPFEARVVGVDYFETPTRGRGPVVYLAVESPGLRALHDRLTESFDAIAGIEGSAYVPHVTLARGGSVETAADLSATTIEPISWTVSRLDLWSAEYREVAESIRLPR
ncbi:2'-5' RNA ligase family protein [Halegenticoccus tardaugens]|uniref:2'-5' RNA ligase family protein n=1 Tax=Halegenticoccus tardaugens TaxID=2071624 RepID=UPI00100C1D71|nr:2'-5' RNA ligase family protein [Halegenticoccus tardaugens]